MSQKHLKELLKEDQEPFYLKDYIADKQCLLRKQSAPPNNKLELKKSSKPTSNLCKNACFFSLQDSPDLRKSPKLFNFPPSPVPNRSPNRVFLHVPAKTATLLLEAAIKIQKKKSKQKPTTQVKNSGFGLFGSMLKRLTLRNRIKSSETATITENVNKGGVSLVNVESGEAATNINISSSVSSSSSSGRSSSLDLETSSSGRSFDGDEKDEDFEFTNVLRGNNDTNIINNFNNNNEDYYSSPICSSPFRFALHKTPSPERCSLAKSPVRCKFQVCHFNSIIPKYPPFTLLFILFYLLISVFSNF